jgi:hypothetical protein
MANEEHVWILLEDVVAWNQWRKENPNTRPDLAGATLNGANLMEADLCRSNLRGAKLRFAELRGAYLRSADLSGAHLNSAELSGADFIDADLSKANLTGARIGLTTFAAVDFSGAIGLDLIQHEAPSFVGIDTILRSKDSIPDIFLRGVGLPDQFILYARSLAATAIEFYSCFISCSSKDRPVVERLWTDLQAKGVRCYYALEDMRIGDLIRPRIDEAIRRYDKLLLVLSEHSLADTQVSDQVEAALEKEQRQRKTVIFPITLDDAVLDSDEAWAGKVRRERYIGDFRQWKNHDAYQVAFERLLRVLKAEGG